ncbi:hypothetical protein INT48_004507 [Thamnidium elegans]|uniref:Trichome birefringence-like C-terminal domain-containing protein n=1 Tax=Thamnidium elegans TaxID=101142 RepID=A0A8H7SXY0_9FUNG|nr:hypothetical protein INT48_004507 [Thamnidium elegans]
MVINKQRNTKYIYIVSIFGCIILWITVYTPTPLLKIEYTDRQPISQDSSLCTPELFNQGRWIYDPIDIESPTNQTQFAKAAGYHCLKKFAHRCFRRGKDESLRAKQIMDYRWQPETCRSIELNPKVLAEHFREHPILFVGDSITQLQFESLACLLGEHFPNRHPPKSNLNGGNTKIKVNELAAVDRETSSLAYIRSDYLLRLDDYKVISPFEDVGSQLGNGENYPWVHALDRFDYIVLNTGPHWHPNIQWGPNQSEQELLAAFKKAMSAVLDYLKNNVKSHQKVWIRTTPYGHASCSQFKEPQVNPFAPTGRTGEYEWHLFQEFDNIWKHLLADDEDTRFDIFDISTLSNQRGDAHSKPDADCLHTCIPGPVDTWNKLLNHEILKNIN